MKRLLLIALGMWSVMTAAGQTLSYEYSYDNAGNRIRRAVVELNSKDAKGEGMMSSPLTDVIGNGETMMLFPNPTHGSIQFILSGEDRSGRYMLSDMTGRLLEEGRFNGSSMTLDLSARQNGMYLLKLFIDEKQVVYKVIKQ